MIVVDASVILHALTEGPSDPAFVDKLENEGELFAPEVIYLEILSGMRKQLRLNKLRREHLLITAQDLLYYSPA